MKLIIQIPCYNEEHTLPATLADIPREIEGIDEVEILIIDDGSTDETIRVAQENGVDHIVVNRKNLGLARTFRKGLEACLKLGADIIVNTDGDNQYAGWDIPKLIQPILAGEAELVVGNRQTEKVEHFSRGKKILQWFGSGIVSRLAGVDIPDAVSGFRAITREAALKINIVSNFSYTTEMIIQAGKKHMAVASVPVETNPKTRESRLFKSIPLFIQKQVSTMVRMYAMYQPLRVCFYVGSVFFIIGFIPIVRFLILYMMGEGAGHIQSLVIGGALLILGFVAYLFGIVADVVNFNRHLIELTLEKVRRLELIEDEKSKNGKSEP
ncbi:Undecaprenyl-phosphate mannosyltransferase [Pseudodesulfovibrio hydrargyri]|uniref:Undecaprenyl-phosphate mannosyltransferase n=1 Tax=Pseudodesulfovibrio hydrargyri TaxID=2125990 RepID=A0A1J5MQL8_9BACT|nr:glycosyltransferase family 2 protein [Pseudodesulfovibrio hydrargyri]OIQ48910.1 Undecaprenyl-phosphate mannosyltransferase [Pseudodesulfovibrio hydrargyri]